MVTNKDIKNISKGSCKADEGSPDLCFFSIPYICNNSSKKYDPFTILSFSLLFKRFHTQGHFPLKKMTLRQFYNNSPIRKRSEERRVVKKNIDRESMESLK